MLAPTGEVGTGERVTAGEQVVDGARSTTIWPPCSPAPGPMSTTQSARADGVLVVLDDDQRVAEVAQPGQRLDQPVVVALVQPDRRLVEDVEHADQAGADLGGQPDALRLAAGQRARRALEGEVVEPDVEQEAEPRVDLLEHPLGDLRARGRSARRRAGTRRTRGSAARQTSAIDRPPTRTASDSGLSREPSQAGHGTSRM